ncbi:MAG: glycosyltransferase 87 family protein [Cyanobacteria bacterium P01_G01_bin.67]
MYNQTEKYKTSKKSRIINLLLITVTIVSIVGMIVDLHHTLVYPGTDLRNRVVGARLMLKGIDPYFFKWHPGLSAKFYDPFDNPIELLSKLSVPPTVLVLHSIMAGLSYIQQKLIWLIVQWSAFIGTILIFIKTSNSRHETKLILIISAFFANSLFWRFHINSGQIYIIYVFLLAIAWFFLKEIAKYNDMISGFFVGVTSSLRPSFILFFIPFIFRQKYSFLLGGLLGLLSSISLSYKVAGDLIWEKYILTMLGMTGLIDLNTYLSPEAKTLPSEDIVYPKIIEGFDSSIRNPLEQHLDNTSFYDILNALYLPHKRYILVIGFITFLVFVSVFITKYLFPKKPVEHLFLFGSLICLISDFFIPVGRYSYYDIQMILPLLIIINQTETTYLVRSKNNIFLLSGLLLSTVGFVIVPRALFFSVFLIIFYILITSSWIFKQTNIPGVF